MHKKNHTDRRQALIHLGQLGSLFLGLGAFNAWAKTQSPAASKPVSKSVADGVSEKQSSTHPERLIRPDASFSEPLDHTLWNPATKRKIGIRIRLPEVKDKTGLIIYSPGLGSGLNNGAPWCEAWCKAGFVVVTLSHPVTNDEIWDTAKQSLKANLRDALAFPQYGLRVTDCKFIIDACLADPDLGNFIDSERIGIAGHSYGALTVQSIAGQTSSKTSLADPRIKAAIAFSPTAMSLAAATSMKSINMPFFCVMGNHDNYVTFTNGMDSKRLGVELSKRKYVYKGLPPGRREQLVLSNADHMSFAGENLSSTPPKFSRDLPITTEQENKTWKKISETTTLFWQANLGKNVSAKVPKKYQEAMRMMLDKEDEYTAD